MSDNGSLVEQFISSEMLTLVGAKKTGSGEIPGEGRPQQQPDQVHQGGRLCQQCSQINIFLRFDI